MTRIAINYRPDDRSPSAGVDLTASAARNLGRSTVLSECWLAGGGCRVRCPGLRLHRALWCLFVMVLSTSSISGHPHNEPETFFLRGTLTKVDVVNRTIEVDTIDARTRAIRNVLVFVDKKVNLRTGKVRLDIEALKAGLRVTCTGDRLSNESHGERMVAFEIQVASP